jgi:hypothetical protein
MYTLIYLHNPACKASLLIFEVSLNDRSEDSPSIPYWRCFEAGNCCERWYSFVSLAHYGLSQSKNLLKTQAFQCLDLQGSQTRFLSL